MEDASIVRIRPKKGKGKGEMVPLETKTVSQLYTLEGKADVRPMEHLNLSINSSINGIHTSGHVRHLTLNIG